MTGHFETKSDGGVDAALIPTPPDGGWGWLVVFGSFMIHVLADGVTYSFGIFFSQFLEEFKSGKGVTSWIGSILVGVTYGSGPLASGLTNRYGCRTVTIIGAIIAAFGCILSYFATSVYFLMFSFGGITGLGFGLIYLPAIVSVTMYFERKRAFATGIAVCGSGVGTFVMAPLIKWLIGQYQWRGAMLIVGAMTLNNCIFGALFRPINVVKEHAAYIDLDACSSEDDEDNEVAKEVTEISTDGVEKPSLVDADDEDDDIVMPVVILRRDNAVSNGDAIGASLPLLATNSGKTKQHKIARRAFSRDTAIKQRSVSVEKGRKSVVEEEISSAATEPLPPHAVYEDGGGVEVAAHEQVHIDDVMPSNDANNVSKYTKSDTHLAVPLSPTKSSHTQHVSAFASSHHSLFPGGGRHLRNNIARSSSSHHQRRTSGSGNSPRRRHHPRYIFDRHPDINLDLIFGDGSAATAADTNKTTYLAPFSRRDAFFQGSVVNLDEYKSAPKLYDVNMLNIRPSSPTLSSSAADDRQKSAETPLRSSKSWKQKLPEIMRQMLDVSLLKDPVYLLFAISNFLTIIGFNAPYTFLPDRVDAQYSALIISIVGVANTIGRVVLGMMSDKKYVNRLYLYNIALTLCGIFTALSVINDSIYWLGLYAALFGASMGCYVSLTSVILVDLLSLEKLTNAFGLLLLFQGIASLIGAPLVGWIYDATGSYYWPFILLGIVISLSGLMLFAIPVVKKRQRQRESRRTPTTFVATSELMSSIKTKKKPVVVVAAAASENSAVMVGQNRRKRNVSFATDDIGAAAIQLRPIAAADAIRHQDGRHA